MPLGSFHRKISGDATLTFIRCLASEVNYGNVQGNFNNAADQEHREK
jgi:hypothetical protein